MSVKVLFFFLSASERRGVTSFRVEPGFATPSGPARASLRATCDFRSFRARLGSPQAARRRKIYGLGRGTRRKGTEEKEQKQNERNGRATLPRTRRVTRFIVRADHVTAGSTHRYYASVRTIQDAPRFGPWAEKSRDVGTGVGGAARNGLRALSSRRRSVRSGPGSGGRGPRRRTPVGNRRDTDRRETRLGPDFFA